MKKSKLKNKKIENRWTKFYPEGVEANLKYSDATMVGYLLEAVARFPESIAYDFYGYTCTYRELYERIRECAKSLKTLGIEKGDRVTICMPNTPSAVIMFYAINMVGGIASMVHPLSAENEIEEYLNNSESKILFVLDLCYSKVRNIIDTTKVKKVIITSVSDDLKNIKKLVYKYNSRGKVPTLELNDDVMTWREFLNYGYDYQGEVICLQKAEDVAVILYSGGTSGAPKGILLSNRNFNALALQAHKMVEATGQGKSLLAILPIFHGFGLCVCIHVPLSLGLKCILVPKINKSKINQLIKSKKPNLLPAIPSMLNIITNSVGDVEVAIGMIKEGKDGLAYLASLDHNMLEVGGFILSKGGDNILGLQAYASSLFEISNIQMFGLTAAMCLVPIICFIITYFVCKKKYIIDEEMYDKILKEIAERKANA